MKEQLILHLKEKKITHQITRLGDTSFSLQSEKQLKL